MTKNKPGLTINVLMAGTAQSERVVDGTGKKKLDNDLWEKSEFCFDIWREV